MSYVKLDTAILASTLWEDRGSRDVFITMLLMAEPFEVTAPMEAMEVRSLDPNGFIIEPGWYGLVPAAGIGIVRRALVPVEEGMIALHALSSPDTESRSKSFEGRRIARVDGGYLVLNYVLYREKDHTAAERMQRYRHRKRAHQKQQETDDRYAVTSRGDAVTPSQNVDVTRNVTHAVTASASASVALPKKGQKQKNSTGREEEGHSASPALPDPLDAVLDEAQFDLRRFAEADASLVRAFLRGQRSPFAVAATLRSHLVDEEVPPAALALAVREYAALAEPSFRARHFGGFVKRARSHLSQAPARAMGRCEERFIGSEDVEAERAAREEAATREMLADFARTRGDEYEALMAQAEMMVDHRVKGTFRTPVVQGALAKLVRDAMGQSNATR